LYFAKLPLIVSSNQLLEGKIMKKISSLLIVLGFCISACSTHPAFFEYSEFKDMTVKGGAVNGQELGAVSGEDGGAIWDNCTEKARGSVREMIHNAKSKGATAIGDVKWDASNNSTPTCKKSWGYFVLWPFVLTPLFMSTHVTGQAYKTGGKSAGIYDLPKTKEGEEALVTYITSLGR
jgi:hypothetical protein